MRGHFKIILFILLSAIAATAHAQNSRAIKLSLEMIPGDFFGLSDKRPNPLDLPFTAYNSQLIDQKKTTDLFPNKRKKILTLDNGQGQISVYATASSSGDITTEFFIHCDFESDGQYEINDSNKYVTKYDKKSSDDFGCIGSPIVIADYWYFPAIKADFKVENIKGKPLADFCPTTVKTIADTVQYGMTVKKYFEPAGKLVEKSSTKCTYQGTVITKVSGQPTTTETNKKISIALEKLAK